MYFFDPKCPRLLDWLCEHMVDNIFTIVLCIAVTIPTFFVGAILVWILQLREDILCHFKMLGDKLKKKPKRCPICNRWTRWNGICDDCGRNITRSYDVSSEMTEAFKHGKPLRDRRIDQLVLRGK